MKTAGKIAVGVVLVAVVVGSVMKGPAWKQRLRVWHYERILNQLTPEQAIALCGKPILDEMQTAVLRSPGLASSDGVARRRLIVRNYYALAVELDFAAAMAEPKKWRLTSVQDPSGEIKYKTPASEIGVLPCLDKKEK
jgi:hypothetical protein